MCICILCKDYLKVAKNYIINILCDKENIRSWYVNDFTNKCNLTDNKVSLESDIIK